MVQGPVDNHASGKGPGQGAAAPEVHQDHEGSRDTTRNLPLQALPREAGGPGPAAPPSRPPRLSLQHLRKLNNFNSYLAILSALDSAPIRRLEWQKQTSEVSGWEGSQEVRGPGWWLWQGMLRSGDLVSGPCSATSLLGDRGSPSHLSLLFLISSHWPEGLRGWHWGCYGVVSCHLLLRPVPGSWLHLLLPQPVLLEGLL